MLNRYEIQEFIDACCQVLDIKSVPLEFYPHGAGSFLPSKRTISINENQFRDDNTKCKDIFEVIAHECVHAWQHDNQRLVTKGHIIIFDNVSYDYNPYFMSEEDYFNLPWEKEANESMVEVATKAHALLADRKKVA